jgi:hypothetical protein
MKRLADDRREPWTSKGLMVRAAGAKPILLPRISVKPNASPAFGDYRVGDVVRVRYKGGLTKVDQQFYVTEIQPSVDRNQGRQDRDWH